jgi:hypothetical protein
MGIFFTTEFSFLSGRCVQRPARPPHPASQVPMAASHARPQPDQPWHKPRFLSSISAAQKAEQPPKQEKLRRVGGKLPQQRERERGASFLQFLHTAIPSPLRCKRFQGSPREARTAFSLFPAWSGVGVATTTERRTPIPLPERERRIREKPAA